MQQRLENVYAADPEAAAKAPVVTADQDWDTWLTAAEADPAAPYQIIEEGSPQDSPPLPPEVAQQQEQAPPVPVPVQ